MRKLLFVGTVLVSFLLVSAAVAQVWYPANQKTVAWDVVTTDDSGLPLPPGAIVGYKAYYKTTLVTTPVFLIELAVNQVTVTFPAEGSYFFGVSAIRKEGDVLVSESPISWSDLAANCQNGETFGIRFYKNASGPRNLRPLEGVQIPLRTMIPKAIIPGK